MPGRIVGFDMIRSAQNAKNGRYACYVCQSKLKHGKATCGTPRLSSRRFESHVVGKMRIDILTERNIRDLAKRFDEETGGAAREHREKLASIPGEIDDVLRRLGRFYAAIDDSNLKVSDLASLIRELRDREHKLLEAQRDVETK